MNGRRLALSSARAAPQGLGHTSHGIVAAMTDPSRVQEGFASLEVHDWRQFTSVNLEFHPRLTVLTGANASGKTTLLNILGTHFNWSTAILGVPAKTSGGTIWRLDSRAAGTRSLGTLTYRSGAASPLTLSESGGPEQSLTLQGQQSVPGLYINSHRSISRYQPLTSIPAEFSRSELVFQQFFQELLNRYVGSYTVKNPLTAMKEAVIAAALYGEGNQGVESNPEAQQVWEGFQEALRHVLPATFGFKSLLVRAPDVLVQTENGDFLIDAVSGGISSIMELTWMVLLRSQQFAAFTVCMDEPENHLHPSLQRSLIPGLLRAFPSLSFIVATHSPFIVTSVPDSHVYVLEDRGGGIEARLLEVGGKSSSADETLQRVLGMTSTLPLWVEGVLNGLLHELRDEGATAANIRQLQLALRELGLDEQFPAAVDALSRTSDA